MQRWLAQAHLTGLRSPTPAVSPKQAVTTPLSLVCFLHSSPRLRARGLLQQRHCKEIILEVFYLPWNSMLRVMMGHMDFRGKRGWYFGARDYSGQVIPGPRHFRPGIPQPLLTMSSSQTHMMHIMHVWTCWQVLRQFRAISLLLLKFCFSLFR